MGVSYREYLKAKKIQPASKVPESCEIVSEWQQAEERATLRAQYFAVARRRHRPSPAEQARLIDA